MKGATAFLMAAMAVSAVAEDIENQPLKLEWQLPSCATLEGNILKVKVPESKAGESQVARAKFSMAPYLGRELAITVWCRGKNVKKAMAHWLGAKLEMSFKDAYTGEMHYPQCRMPWGDFEGEYTMVAPLYGYDAKEAELILGLTQTSGEIEFDLSTLRLSSNRKRFPPKNQGLKAAYSDRVRNLPRLRGAQVDPLVSEKDLDDLVAWGANFIHYQFGCFAPELGDTKNLTEMWGTLPERIEYFRAFTRRKLDYFEKNVLPWARARKMKVCVVHFGWNLEPYKKDEGYQAYKDMWVEIATRLKGNEDVIYAYDLWGEPNQPMNTKYGYLDMQEDIARAIRKVDPVTPISIESNQADEPSAYNYLNALDLKDIIYQVHIYQPISFTHQGIGPARQYRASYPQPAKDGAPAVDIEFLRKTLEPVRKFQLEHKCRIFVGEFSAVIWADGAAQYLEDVISLFEEYGWDWTYHAFREAGCWSVEYEGTDRAHRWKAKSDTDRKKVLLEGLKKNETPTPANFGE